MKVISEVPLLLSVPPLKIKGFGLFEAILPALLDEPEPFGLMDKVPLVSVNPPVNVLVPERVTGQLQGVVVQVPPVAVQREKSQGLVVVVQVLVHVPVTQSPVFSPVHVQELPVPVELGLMFTAPSPEPLFTIEAGRI